MKHLFKLTDSQREWLTRRKIDVDQLYMLPRYGFHAYAGPNFNGAGHIDTNPFTKSLDNELVIIKAKENGFVRCNFYERRAPSDWWMTEDAMSRRDVAIILFLTLTCYIPMIVWNLFTRKSSPLKQE